MAYPVENLLRRPAEYLAAAASFAAAGIVATAPDWLLMTKSIGLAAGGAFILHGLWRIRAGRQVTRYQKNLRRLPKYNLASKDIPWSERKLFLGVGFRWDQRHTQRLADVRLPEYRHFREPGMLYMAARRLELRVERTQLAWLGQLLRTDSAWNPVAPMPEVGGDPAIHGIEPDERPVWEALGERVGHKVVLGTTRVGKTRFAEICIAQDIRRGDVVIVFDPKGDADLLKRMYSEARHAGRENEFYMFHLGFPRISARYNPVGSFSRITEVATRIANQLPGEGQSRAFKEFVWRFVNTISRTLVALGRTPDYEQIARYATEVDPLILDYYENWLSREGPPNWRDEVDRTMAELLGDKRNKAPSRGPALQAKAMVAYARDAGLFDPVAHALGSITNYERSYFDKLVASLLPLLDKLTTGYVAELLSPDASTDDHRPVFSWMNIINTGGIVYVGLDALTDFEVAAAVGNSMFADLTSVAGRIYKHGSDVGQSDAAPKRRLSIHADEFNELVGPEFIPMLNKAGGAGYQVTVYTQTWSDVEAKIGDKAKAAQIAGNLNTMVMLRVKNTETAEMLTDQLPEVSVVSTTLASAATDNSDPGEWTDFSSRNEDRVTTQRVAMLAAADLVQLPKGQAFALIEGGQLYKLRFPLPTPDDDVPPDLEQIAGEMRLRYNQQAPGEEWWSSSTPSAATTTMWPHGLVVEGRGCGF
jgi:conjugative coupling factor TraD (TOL family)